MLEDSSKLIVPCLLSIRRQRGCGLKLLMLKMWQFQTNVSPLFLEIKNHYKHMLNSPLYIFGFQTLSMLFAPGKESHHRCKITQLQPIQSDTMKRGKRLSLMLHAFCSFCLQNLHGKKFRYQMVIYIQSPAGAQWVTFRLLSFSPNTTDVIIESCQDVLHHPIFF